jgi:hypothetical protein
VARAPPRRESDDRAGAAPAGHARGGRSPRPAVAPRPRRRSRGDEPVVPPCAGARKPLGTSDVRSGNW